MWSSATQNINGNTSYLKVDLNMSSSVGLTGPYSHVIPLPYYDHCGDEIVIQAVLLSRKSGRYSSNYT